MPVAARVNHTLSILLGFMDKQSEQMPFNSSPIKSIELNLNSVIQFDSHKNVSCFNACCRNIGIVMTPYDIVRLKQRFGLLSHEFVGTCTTPYPMDHHDVPGFILNTKSGTTECVFSLRKAARFTRIDQLLVTITHSAAWVSARRTHHRLKISTFLSKKIIAAATKNHAQFPLQNIVKSKVLTV